MTLLRWDCLCYSRFHLHLKITNRSSLFILGKLLNAFDVIARLFCLTSLVLRWIWDYSCNRHYWWYTIFILSKRFYIRQIPDKLKVVFQIAELTYSTAPLSFRDIFKENGSSLNSTLYFGLNAFSVAFGIGTGTSYLLFLESYSCGGKKETYVITSVFSKRASKARSWLLLADPSSRYI